MTKEKINKGLAQHTHALISRKMEGHIPTERNVGSGYTWNNGVVVIKTTSNITIGDTITLRPLQE